MNDLKSLSLPISSRFSSFKSLTTSASRYLARVQERSKIEASQVRVPTFFGRYCAMKMLDK
jgi:hypothetical protein